MSEKLHNPRVIQSTFRLGRHLYVVRAELRTHLDVMLYLQYLAVMEHQGAIPVETREEWE